jgi:hypothetical protein
LTDGKNWAAPIWSQAEWDEATTPSPPAAGNLDVTPIPSSPDESVVPRQNLNSHGTHSVPAQVIARLYSSHFSTRENVAAESQEIAELYNRHFPDAWYSMPENAVADAAALTANAAAGTADAVASTDDAGTNANNNSDSSYKYHMDDEAFDATYDDRNWRKLQREADAEADEQHYYT